MTVAVDYALTHPRGREGAAHRADRRRHPQRMEEIHGGARASHARAPSAWPLGGRAALQARRTIGRVAMVTADKLPPFDIEAEEACIASILVDEEAIGRVEGVVHPDDFYRDQNRWAYEACLALWERNEPINQVTLAHELSRREKLDDVGRHPVPRAHRRRAGDAGRRRALRAHRQARRDVPRDDHGGLADRAGGVPGRPGSRGRDHARREPRDGAARSRSG